MGHSDCWRPTLTVDALTDLKINDVPKKNKKGKREA